MTHCQEKEDYQYMCPKCKWGFPIIENIISQNLHIQNKCFNCGAKVWDNEGKFLGSKIRIKARIYQDGKLIK